MELPDRGHAKGWEGLDVLDLSGQPLGTCVGIFADTDTELVEWLLVAVTGQRRSFVPAVDSVEDGGRVRLPFPRELVLAAPDVGDAQQLAKADEIALYRHYDVPYTDDASGSLLPDEVTVAGDDDGDLEDPGVPLVAPEPLGAVGTAAVVDPLVEPYPLADVDPPTASEPPPGVEEEVVVEDVREVPPPAAGGRDQDVLAAVAPLAAVGAGVVAVWLVLRAVERRAARRRSLPARAQRLRSRTAAAASTAASSAVAARTSASSAAGAAAASAGAETERLRRRAAELAEQQRKAAAATRKAAAKQRKAAAKKRAAAQKAAAKQHAQAAAAAAERREQAQQSLSAATSAVQERTTQAVAAVTAVPSAAAGSVAATARSVRRSTAGLLWDLATASAAAGGYVLGARAGRERYEQISEVAAAAAARPEVQTAKQALTEQDAERRAEALRTLKDQGQQLLTRVLPG